LGWDGEVILMVPSVMSFWIWVSSDFRPASTLESKEWNG